MPLPSASPLTAAIARRVSTPSPQPGGYAPYKPLDRPLMSGTLPVPKNDAEAVGLIHQSKAAWDNHMAKVKNAHPIVRQVLASNLQKHVDSVANAIHAYHKATPSQTSEMIVRGMHADPNMKITAPMPNLS